ncbi:Alpha-tocopherol transfer protein-like [Amphibalanus amphitrite]|uniref:Alpha-tocopherol transfer protein-like n=1 Tax=Amphibalanus amphitrite TaxID=1232801 RepID=A0A6A4X158_AMPAM|nr:Alpha-tocopherol transfer protein-like [Amphibalanus amphitrite]
MAGCSGEETDEFQSVFGSSDFQLTPELRKKAEEELQEKEEWRERDIAALRDLVADDADLNSRMDDEFLLRFLRARKFDYDSSFQMLQQYYWTRARHQHLFDRLLPSTQERVLRHGLQMVLPQRDPNGCRVFVFRPGAWDPSAVTMDDIFISNVLLLEHMAREQATQVCGVVAIQDFTGFGFHQMKHFTTEHIRRMISILQIPPGCFLRTDGMGRGPMIEGASRHHDGREQRPYVGLSSEPQIGGGSCSFSLISCGLESQHRASQPLHKYPEQEAQEAGVVQHQGSTQKLLRASQKTRTEESLILKSLNMICLIGLTLFVQLDLQALQLSMDLLHMMEFEGKLVLI